MDGGTRCESSVGGCSRLCNYEGAFASEVDPQRMGHAVVCDGVCFAYYKTIRDAVWKKRKVDGCIWM